MSFAEKCDICNAKTDCIDSQEQSHSTTTETKTVHKIVASVSQLTKECALVSKNQLTSPSFATSKTVITRKPTEDIDKGNFFIYCGNFQFFYQSDHMF